MSHQQQTLVQSVSCVGVGVHTGVFTKLHVKPAPADHGICFYRTDLDGGRSRRIDADASCVTGLTLGTTLSNSAGDTVSTVEHLMAACFGCGIDNLIIELDGPEVPIMDGSAAVFCELFETVGYLSQNSARKYLKLLETVEVQDGEKWARFVPTDTETLSLSAQIDFETPAIGVQEASVDLVPGAFIKDVAFARTFGFYHEVDALQKMGFARGGSLENAIIIREHKVVNPEGLRSSDEFIRHKLLDAIGDLALAGGHLIGGYEAYRPGHALNNALLRKLLDTKTAWRWMVRPESVEAGKSIKPHFPSH